MSRPRFPVATPAEQLRAEVTVLRWRLDRLDRLWVRLLLEVAAHG